MIVEIPLNEYKYGMEVQPQLLNRSRAVGGGLSGLWFC